MRASGRRGRSVARSTALLPAPPGSCQDATVTDGTGAPTGERGGAWAVLGGRDLAPRADLGVALDQLGAARLEDPSAEAARGQVLALAREHPDLLDRRCRPGHLTGSALVVEEGTGQVLVLWHRKLQRWLQPGGHADGDGDLAHVAWREATEETGIEGLRVVVPAVHVDVHEVRPPGEDAHLHLDVRFCILAPAGAEAIGNHESEALRWVAPDELPSLGADEGLLALASAASRVLPWVGR